eukprot:maker-scaffold417_size177606-snap-gene-0.51 protein:Tk07604 transcript:maker-scaffold417_size177606-snap-gene-0.51-mRNA-1 annotation:"unnamed protein product"
MSLSDLGLDEILHILRHVGGRELYLLETIDSPEIEEALEQLWVERKNLSTWGCHGHQVNMTIRTMKYDPGRFQLRATKGANDLLPAKPRALSAQKQGWARNILDLIWRLPYYDGMDYALCSMKDKEAIRLSGGFDSDSLKMLTCNPEYSFYYKSDGTYFEVVYVDKVRRKSPDQGVETRYVLSDMVEDMGPAMFIKLNGDHTLVVCDSCSLYCFNLVDKFCSWEIEFQFNPDNEHCSDIQFTKDRVYVTMGLVSDKGMMSKTVMHVVDLTTGEFLDDQQFSICTQSYAYDTPPNTSPKSERGTKSSGPPSPPLSDASSGLPLGLLVENGSSRFILQGFCLDDVRSLWIEGDYVMMVVRPVLMRYWAMLRVRYNTPEAGFDLALNVEYNVDALDGEFSEPFTTLDQDQFCEFQCYQLDYLQPTP